MRKPLMTWIGVFGIVVGVIASPVLAFQCPALINQANEAMTKVKADDAKLKQAKDLVAEAQKLHNAGQHAESVKKANEALALLGVTAPSRRGYSY